MIWLENLRRASPNAILAGIDVTGRRAFDRRLSLRPGRPLKLAGETRQTNAERQRWFRQARREGTDRTAKSWRVYGGEFCTDARCGAAGHEQAVLGPRELIKAGVKNIERVAKKAKQHKAELGIKGLLSNVQRKDIPRALFAHRLFADLAAQHQRGGTVGA